MDKVIEKTTFIYVSGGSTFFLLKEEKKKHADKVIRKEINNEIVYIDEINLIHELYITYSKEKKEQEKVFNN
ncbi:Type 1 glutamine amidotransferase-like domain-containing protein [Bacillus sp. 2205SS5-2]|uniref:Type 1 glutamine amidotransferase-like domain-containing protein n=1 Tax=Bacillus sp. 2205SS5-2 TaxID=3109031 RepID=UPI003FA5F793